MITRYDAKVKKTKTEDGMEYTFNELMKIKPEVLDQLLADYLMRYYDMTDEQQKKEREKLSRMEIEHGIL